MRARTILLGIGGVLLVALIATPIVLMPGPVVAEIKPAEAIGADEQAATIAAMAPPKRPDRPVIAIVTWNKATEVSDFLSIYGVLKRADVADVTVVAELASPVDLYPAGLTVMPESTMAAFDAAYPDGADYVVVPAMDPGTDPVIAEWLRAQHAKGSKIISVCNGSRMMGTAGLLDGRRATAHWSAVEELRKKYPTMEWVPDRRYLIDNGVGTSTGITANIPTMIALVEAIGGRAAATRVAGELGVVTWDARHNSSAFGLNLEHMKTFVRNNAMLWRHETVGIPVEEGVDEVALGFLVDAYERTELVEVVAVGSAPEVRTRHSLILGTGATMETAEVDHMLAPPPAAAPAALLDAELAKIAERYDAQTAAIVTLVMEYPWNKDRAAGTQ